MRQRETEEHKKAVQKKCAREWRIINKMKIAIDDRNRQLKKLCGITLSFFNKVLGWQHYKCAICGTTDPGLIKNGKLGWHADHNHKTGKFRGILCQNCNKGLGHFQDSPILLMAAILYLIQEERHGKVANVELVEVENGLAAVVRSLARSLCARVDADGGRAQRCVSLRDTGR